MPKIEATGLKVSNETVKKYENILPADLIKIWKEYGYCTMLDGYLRVIDPDDYKELIDDTYFFGKVSVPIMVTAFGDVVTTCRNGEIIDIVKYKYGVDDVIAACFDMFMKDMESEFYQNEIAHLDVPKYQEAVKKLGRLDHDECFGYVPLLGLGGPETVEHLQKVKTREHIEIITQLVGKIGM